MANAPGVPSSFLDGRVPCRSDVARSAGRGRLGAWAGVGKHDAGTLKGALHCGDVRSARGRLVVLEVAHCDDAHAGGAGEISRIPPEQATRGAALRGCHHGSKPPRPRRRSCKYCIIMQGPGASLNGENGRVIARGCKKNAPQGGAGQCWLLGGRPERKRYIYIKFIPWVGLADK